MIYNLSETQMNENTESVSMITCKAYYMQVCGSQSEVRNALARAKYTKFTYRHAYARLLSHPPTRNRHSSSQNHHSYYCNTKGKHTFLCFKLHHTYTPNGLYANCDHIIRSINKKIGVSCDFIRFEVALSFGASQKKKKIKIKSGIKGFAVVVFAVMPSHPFSGSRHTTLHPSKTSIYQYIFRYDSPKWNWRNFQIIIKYIWCVVFLFISGLNNVHAVAIQFCLFVMFVAVLFAIAIFINECEVARACAHVRACARQCIV